jgi:hypothetical protein
MVSSPRILRLIMEVSGLTETERAELADELERLRLAAARQLLDEYTAEHGPISDDERAQVRREWPRD